MIAVIPLSIMEIATRLVLQRRYGSTQAMNPMLHLAVSRHRRRRRRLFVLAVLAFLLIGQEVVCRLVFPLREVIGFNRIRYQSLAPGDPRSRRILERGLVYDRLKFES